MALNKVDSPAIASRPFLITFSGIDGAGKTTQIERVSECLQQRGFRVLRLSFWDHVAVWSKMRAGIGQRAVHGDQEEHSAEGSFAPKNSKHVRKWYLTAARSGLYLLEVARLHHMLASPPLQDSDVVIFDRYIYDQIANIYSQSLAARTYARVLLKLSPAPDLAFILDASPTEAFARKPEYPLEFVHRNRWEFLRLRELVPQLIIIPSATAEDVANQIHIEICRSRLLEGAALEGKTELAADSAVVRLQSSCSVQNNPTASM
ncbi:MAG: thymidylate kinase [Terriglobales bacterium]|jgi:thymidylate kinase